MHTHSTMGLFIIIGFLIFSTASCNLWVGHGQSIFNVLNFGAKGDGQSDDAQAFVRAWEAVCGASEGTTPTLVVPAGHTFHVSQISFKGPCKSNKVHVQILGNLVAPQRDAWGECSKRWLHFVGVGNMTVDGTGVINGQGQAWWGNLTDGCRGIPTALLLERCDGVQVRGLTLINGPGSHIYVVHSQDVTISNVNISSPLGSHNTDGIDISNALRVNIHDSFIGSGDDHIAIKGGTEFLNVSNITCAQGHGISVGSLGQNGEEEYVHDVHVWNCSFSGADSAVKIKTWPGGKGYVKSITFEQIIVNQTRDPIFIDQHYMHTPEQKQALKVSDVTFSDIHGTSFDERAIVLDCANRGCSNITLKHIRITSIDPKKPASAICNNVQGTAMDTSPRVHF